MTIILTIYFMMLFASVELIHSFIEGRQLQENYNKLKNNKDEN